MQAVESNTQSLTRQGGVEIADLDALVSKPVTFRLHGKIHTIEPVSMLRYLEFVNGMATLGVLETKKEAPLETEMRTAVLKLFNSVIPTLTAEDLMQCTQAQIAALMSLVIDHVQGRLVQKKN